MVSPNGKNLMTRWATSQDVAIYASRCRCYDSVGHMQSYGRIDYRRPSLNSNNLKGPWARPDIARVEGTHVSAARLDHDADVDDLYEVSHRSEEYKSLWTYLGYGPFANKEAMRAWLVSIKDSADPI